MAGIQITRFIFHLSLHRMASSTRLSFTALGTLQNGQPRPQTIVVGPLAAFIPMKQLGTNGGGFYGMNSAHPSRIPLLLRIFCPA
jgi:K+-transporting ATPase ATPase A chain